MLKQFLFDLENKPGAPDTGGIQEQRSATSSRPLTCDDRNHGECPEIECNKYLVLNLFLFDLENSPGAPDIGGIQEQRSATSSGPLTGDDRNHLLIGVHYSECPEIE